MEPFLRYFGSDNHFTICRYANAYIFLSFSAIGKNANNPIKQIAPAMHIVIQSHWNYSCISHLFPFGKYSKFPFQNNTPLPDCMRHGGVFITRGFPANRSLLPRLHPPSAYVGHQAFPYAHASVSYRWCEPAPIKSQSPY